MLSLPRNFTVIYQIKISARTLQTLCRRSKFISIYFNLFIIRVIQKFVIVLFKFANSVIIFYTKLVPSNASGTWVLGSAPQSINQS